MHEIERTKAANKVALENKYILKQTQLEQHYQQLLRSLNTQYEERCLIDSSQLIDLRMRLQKMEKSQFEKDQLLLEQEVMLRQLLNNKVAPQRRNAMLHSQNLIEMEQLLECNNDLINKLRAKVQKLVNTFIILRLYSLEYGQKVCQDDFDMGYLVIPKLSDDSTLIKQLQDSEAALKEQNAVQEEHILLLNVENKKLIQENRTMKRCINKFDVTATLDLEKYKKLNKELEDSIEERNNYIQELLAKLEMKRPNRDCKQLNDFIIKKRFRSLHEQPAFNLQESSKRWILDRNNVPRMEKVTAQRIHSTTLQLKY